MEEKLQQKCRSDHAGIDPMPRQTSVSLFKWPRPPLQSKRVRTWDTAHVRNKRAQLTEEESKTYILKWKNIFSARYLTSTEVGYHLLINNTKIQLV